MQINMLIA